MKTQVFMVLLNQLAKVSLPEAAYRAFNAQYNLRRWQLYKRNFPELWDKFSDKFNAIKDQLSSNADPQKVAEMIVPGRIDQYPELFEPFRLQIEEIRSSLGPNADLITAIPSDGIIDTEDISNTVSVEGCGGLFGSVVEFIQDLF